MLRYLSVLVLIFSSYSLFSSHLNGGEITWKCQGNGQFVFTINFYTDCPAYSLPSPLYVSGPNGNIIMTPIDTTNLTMPCKGIDSLSCGSINYLGRIQKLRYQSGVVSFQSTPPPSGWVFTFSLSSHNICCGQVTVNNSTGASGDFQSTMYPEAYSQCISSPKFITNVAQVITPSNRNFSNLAESDYPGDSLYYRNAPQNYQSPYTQSHPFPSHLTDPVNGPNVFNNETGMYRFNAKNGAKGLYLYNVIVEQWRDSKLIAEISRENTIGADFSDTINQSPKLLIDTNMFGLTRAARTYTIDAYPGDTVSFDMVALDSGMNSFANQPQKITFHAAGRALESPWSNDTLFTNSAALTPAVGQTGFVSFFQNKVNFSWVIDKEHVYNSNTPYSFHFQAYDDVCPNVAVSNITVVVNVKKPISIFLDSVSVCAGDSVQLQARFGNGDFHWWPATHISSDSISSPYVYPNSSQYYYVGNLSRPGIVDSVYVQVEPKGTFNLTFSMGKLELTGTAQNTTNTWYYNGVPFAYPHDTLTPFGLGDYYVVGRSSACRYVSDTVSITMGMSFSVTSSGNGTYNNTSMPVPGSLGVTFQVNQNTNVSNVSIPGIADVYGKTGGYDLKLQLYDDTQTEIYNKDLTLQKPLDDLVRVPVNFTLNANKDYTLVVSGDTAYTFNLFENLVLPSTPHNVGLTVKSVAEGAHGQFPTAPTAYLLPISFGIGQTVSLEESLTDDWKIYPNPASDQFRVSGLSDAKSLDLVDVNGKVVQRYQLGTDQGEVEVKTDHIAKGLYFIKVHFKNTTSVKKVLFQ